MIRINEDYECQRDTYGWKLHRWRDGKDKDGNQKRTCRTTYHGTLVQVCEAVLDDSAGKAEHAAELADIISTAARDLRIAIAGADNTKELSPNAEVQGRLAHDSG